VTDPEMTVQCAYCGAEAAYGTEIRHVADWCKDPANAMTWIVSATPEPAPDPIATAEREVLRGVSRPSPPPRGAGEGRMNRGDRVEFVSDQLGAQSGTLWVDRGETGTVCGTSMGEVLVRTDGGFSWWTPLDALKRVAQGRDGT